MGDRLHLQMKSRLMVLQKGILSKSWHQRFCVFLIQSNGQSAQIHVFEKEEHFQNKSRDGKVISLEDAKKLQHHKDKNLAFDIIVKGGNKLTFAAENENDYKHWVNTLKHELSLQMIHDPDGSLPSDDEDSDTHLYMDDNVIYESADIAPMFTVTIEDNEVAERLDLRGKYILAVNLHNLALIDRATKKAIYQFPYRYIRRFGKTRSNFQFEAGRRCPSGEGEFSFLTDQGFEIFATFSNTTQKIRNQDEGTSNQLKTSGKSLSNEDGLGASNQLKKSGKSQSKEDVKRSSKGSTLPIQRGSPEVQGAKSNGERKSLRSSGSHMAAIPQALTSELNSVLKHQMESEHSHHSEESSGKKDFSTLDRKNKTVIDKDKPAEKRDKNAEKKARKEQEKREKEQKEQEKKRREQEKRQQKEQAKANKKTLKKNVSNPIPEPAHAYEEVDEVQGRTDNPPPVEDLYDEVEETCKKPTPKPKPRETKPVTDIYSEPHKVRKDGWKNHANPDEQEPVQEENYDKIKVASKSSDLIVVQGPPNPPEEPDETYNHIGGVMANKKPEENVYGIASAKLITKPPEDSGYEEAVIEEFDKALPRGGNNEEPKQRRIVLQSSKNIDDEENAYADIP